MNLPSEKDLAWFERMGKARPTHLPHGVSDTPEHPLSEQLLRLNTKNWRLEGNKLMCDTDQGPLVQFIDPGYICLGTDKNNLPILKKVVS